jgi:hypothetical protein
MSKKKYIYANIRLPIEMSDNGSFYEVFSDRMTIDFESCKTLPPPTSYENKELIAKIFAIQQTDEDEIEVKIDEEDEKKETDEKIEKEPNTEESDSDTGTDTDTDTDTDSCHSHSSENLKKEFSRQKINKSRHNLSFRRRGNPAGNTNKNFTRRMY